MRPASASGAQNNRLLSGLTMLSPAVKISIDDELIESVGTLSATSSFYPLLDYLPRQHACALSCVLCSFLWQTTKCHDVRCVIIPLHVYIVYFGPAVYCLWQQPLQNWLPPPIDLYLAFPRCFCSRSVTRWSGSRGHPPPRRTAAARARSMPATATAVEFLGYHVRGAISSAS